MCMKTVREIFSGLSIAALIIFAVFFVAFAWNPPTASPPGGSGALRVDADNNFGVTTPGSTFDPSYRLDVDGSFRTAQSAYLAAQLGNVGIGTTNPNAKLHVFDGSINQDNPINPLVKGGAGLISKMPTTPALRVEVVGSYAFVTFTGSGSDAFRIIDVSNPDNPRVVGGADITAGTGLDQFPAGASAVDVAVSGRYAYLTFSGSGSGAFRIVDISNLSNPQVVGGAGLTANMPASAGAVAVFVGGKYAYVTFSGGGVNAFRIIDVSNPANPVVVGGSGVSLAAKGQLGIYVDERYAYVALNCQSLCATGGNAFAVIDIGNPANPVVVGGLNLPGYSGGMPSTAPIDLQVHNRYAYLSFLGPAGNAFRIIDVSDPYNPVMKGGINAFNNNPPTTLAFALAVAEDYAYIGFSGTNGDALRIVDVSDPDNPVSVGGWNLTMPAGNGGLAISGGYLYVALNNTGTNRFRIVDVSGIKGVSGSFPSLEAGVLGVSGDTFLKNNLMVGANLTAGGSALVSGNMSVGGTLSKGAGSFLIDHPMDPLTKVLRHSFVESPDMKNIYDDTVILDKNGEAQVLLPSYFGALNRDFRYQLTAVGIPAPNLYIREEILNNRLLIAGGRPFQKVSWQVTGIRRDPYARAYPIIVEEQKPASGYLHPELYR